MGLYGESMVNKITTLSPDQFYLNFHENIILHTVSILSP